MNQEELRRIEQARAEATAALESVREKIAALQAKTKKENKVCR